MSTTAIIIIFIWVGFLFYISWAFKYYDPRETPRDIANNIAGFTCLTVIPVVLVVMFIGCATAPPPEIPAEVKQGMDSTEATDEFYKTVDPDTLEKERRELKAIADSVIKAWEKKYKLK